jgi:hypothetical protein
MIYFDGANDYWTSQSGSCGSAPATFITDLWLNDAPAFGINNSWTCGQAHQPATCVYEDTFFVNETLAAIRDRDPARPFFEVWAPHNIHAPLQVPAAYLNRFSFIEDARRQAYAAKVNYIDDQLALVIAALKAAGLWDNMLFVLTSDNGGPICEARARARDVPRAPLKVSPPRLAARPTRPPRRQRRGGRKQLAAARRQDVQSRGRRARQRHRGGRHRASRPSWRCRDGANFH